MARVFVLTALICLAVFLSACGGGGSGEGGAFRLLQFLEAGQANIPRNRILTFVFSAPVKDPQDLPERLKIENLGTFARAIGDYVVLAEEVIFVPRLPTVMDRSNSGFKSDSNYSVFLKGGPDALQAADGSQLPAQQSFGFTTSMFFEDKNDQPPRGLGVTAIDTTSGAMVSVSRLAPAPNELALLDSNDLITAGRVVEPTKLQLRLHVSEPLDPATITKQQVELREIYSDATESGPIAPPSADPGHYGDPVSYKVPIAVSVEQGVDVAGNIDVDIVVTPLAILVDDTRYRLSFSGNILGIDFRQTFVGQNGLTGDGLDPAFPEPGGLGYTTEFIVRDRPQVAGTRTLTYDPFEDGIQPEGGQTSLDEDFFNRALYNSPSAPSRAVGFVGAFGSGSLGPLQVTNGTFTIDTGDTPNESAETPFSVVDLDPNDSYKNTNGLPTPGLRNFDPPVPTEFDYETITISNNATLKIIGVNGARLLSSGVVSVNGTIDASGGPGDDGVLANPASTGGQGQDAQAGVRGPGGYAGGFARRGRQAGGTTSFPSCSSFDAWVNANGGKPNVFPNSMHGDGPGRGYAGGEDFLVNQADMAQQGSNGSGGGGASHGTVGTYGEDRFNGGSNGNIASPVGSIGKCDQWGIANSGVIGVRGAPGPIYGDREALDMTGGSGGGAGGAANGWAHTQNSTGSGGGGGGGGGFLEIVSVGSILVNGGTITVAGGDGGDGDFYFWTGQAWSNVSGGGGAGSGGTVSLISGSQIDLTGAMLDARGGAGGARAPIPSGYVGSGCAMCNAGGDGGKGYIFLMDADGQVTGFNPGTPTLGQPGNYNSYEFGVLSIRQFDPNRFGGSDAVTELYSVGVPDPTFTPISPSDIIGITNTGQSIDVQMSSASPDPDDPTAPELTTEIPLFTVATVIFDSGSTVVEIVDTGGAPGDVVEGLNTPGVRSSYVRVVAVFNYPNPEQATLGPYLAMDEVTLSFVYN